ncbi:MAG: hypothetical protein Q8O87_01000 [bacterium]|nr:hypothetical protein [bacterium]
MAKDIWPDDFRCPKCDSNKVVNLTMGSRKYAMVRLDLPYFLCGPCRLCSYDKRLIQQTITRWGDYGKKGGWGFSYSQIYQDSIKYLEEVMNLYIKTASYHRDKFKLVNPT